MDIDPNFDTHPPRYAVESDSEDEYGPSIGSSAIHTSEPVKLNLPDRKGLSKKVLIAAGIAGEEWCRGVVLSKAVGDIAVGSTQIGKVHSVSAGYTLLHITSSVPVALCYSVATAVVTHLQPERVAMVDSYSVPTYISEVPVSPHEAPVRFLCTSAGKTLEMINVAPFTPPNLVQLLPAAVLTTLELAGLPGSLILLPVLHVPAPAVLKPMPLEGVTESPWPKQALSLTNDALTDCLYLGHSGWEPAPGRSFPGTSSRAVRPPRNDIIGEGAMYI